MLATQLSDSVLETKNVKQVSILRKPKPVERHVHLLFWHLYNPSIYIPPYWITLNLLLNAFGVPPPPDTTHKLYFIYYY